MTGNVRYMLSAFQDAMLKMLLGCSLTLLFLDGYTGFSCALGTSLWICYVNAEVALFLT